MELADYMQVCKSNKHQCEPQNSFSQLCFTAFDACNHENVTFIGCVVAGHIL